MKSEEGATLRDMSHKPIQMIFSFEAFVNGQMFEPLWSSGFDGMLAGGYHPPVYDVSDFDQRVHEKLSDLKGLGFGGIVVYYDFTDDYLESEAGWQRFIAGLRAAAELGLRVWIFDEKGYPSGTADGRVLAGHPDLEAIGLKRLSFDAPAAGTTVALPDPRATIYAVWATFPDGRRERLSGRSNDRVVNLPVNPLQSVEIYFIAPLFEGTFAWAAGGRRYINVLDRRAVNRFLQLTHVKYFRRIPADLWQHVEAFFTDEVALQSHAMEPGGKPNYDRDPYDPDLPTYPSVPWTDELEDRFLDEHGYLLGPRVPSLFGACGDDDRMVRRDFWSTVSRLYVSAYSQQATDVCAALGVDSSGHMLGEDTILQQVILHADLIQVLKAFRRPGVDLLTCKIENFNRHLLTHKSGLSASFFGTGKGVMSETSDYFESMSPDNQVLLPPDEVKCTLAMQYLLGVRDFCFLFRMDRFPPEVYREICEFMGRLLELGDGGVFAPECGMYYPIEKLWEEYVPTYPCGDVTCAGIFERTVGQGSSELLALDRLITDTAERLFYDNVQYVLCERPDVARLAERGVKTLAYLGPGDPEPGLRRLCKDARLVLVTLEDFEKTRHHGISIHTGPHVVYATYNGFVFALNTGREPSYIDVPGSVKTAFPLVGHSGKSASGRTYLPPLGCAFLFSQ